MSQFYAITSSFADYDDDNVGADGCYDNVDEQCIDEAINSYDPSTENLSMFCWLKHVGN